MELAADSLDWHGAHLRCRVLYSRAGVAQHVWVGTSDQGLVVDTGDGCLRDLLAAGMDLAGIRGIIYTHGHFDHVGGLHPLLGFMRMIGRTARLPIFAPEGCTEVFAIAHNFRRCYPDSVPFEIAMQEVHPHQVVEFGSLRIEAFPMEHAGSIAGGEVLDPIPAFGYRFTSEGESVAITGDTGMCEEVRNLVADADLAIIEATFADTAGHSPETFTKVHLSETMGRELGGCARNFALVHRVQR